MTGKKIRMTYSAEFPSFYRTGDLLAGLIELYEHASSDRALEVAVEVGCAKGESSEVAAQFVNLLYCVDPWSPGFETNEPDFDFRISQYGHVFKNKLPSVVFAETFSDESVDIVYIDAMHDYDNVLQDFLAWIPKVKPCGWIAGHDYSPAPDHAGVVRAVNELFADSPRKIFRDNSFLFRKTPEIVEKVRSATS